MQAVAQDQRIKVSKQFRDDFEKVIKFYNMPTDEVENLRRAARKDYQMVKLSLADTREKIDNGTFK